MMSELHRRLNASVQGEGGRTLVLGNGFCTTQEGWDAIVDAVPAGWRVVRFDYSGSPGTPLDTWSSARYATLHGHAEDVVALLRAVHLRDVVFVGHSMSGIIGALVRLAAPELVGHLVMLATSPRYADEPGEYVGGFSREEVDASMALADADLAAWMAGLAPVVLGADAPPESVRAYATQILRMRPDVARLMIRSIFGTDYRALLRRVDCPVTLLQPSRDATVPVSVGRYLADIMPHATLRVLDVEGHLPHVTSPGVVAEALHDVLTRFALERPTASPGRA